MSFPSARTLNGTSNNFVIGLTSDLLQRVPSKTHYSYQ